MKALVILILSPVFMALSVLMRGWALEKLWRWFAVPPFGLPVLTVAECCGVSLLISYLTYQVIHTEDKRSTGEKIGESLSHMFLGPLLVLAFGYIIKSFL